MKDICNELGHPKEVLLKYISLYFSTVLNKKNLLMVFLQKNKFKNLYIVILIILLCVKCKIPEVIPHIEGTKKIKIYIVMLVVIFILLIVVLKILIKVKILLLSILLIINGKLKKV